MSDLPLDEKIRRQHEALVALFSPLPDLDTFLEEELLPLDIPTLQQAARDVAEMLKVAANDEAAKKALSLDRGKTQAFFSIAKVAFPALQFVMTEQLVWTNLYGLPYFEIGYWISALGESNLTD